MNKTVSLFLIIACCWNCSSKPSTEKHIGKRDNIINVRDRIEEIVIDDPFINDNSRPQIIDKYLFIEDRNSNDKQIHIFDKHSFEYITSTAQKGQGPGEIISMGSLVEDKVNRKFYVTALGKYMIFSFDLDSVIMDPTYLPIEKMKIDEQLFPAEYLFINDTLSIGTFLQPLNNHADYNLIVGKFNMMTGEIRFMDYMHPEVKKRHFTFSASLEHGIYVESHSNYDLITICNLDEELKYNVYGPNWNKETTNTYHYGRVVFCDNRIVLTYSGDKRYTEDIRFNWPTKFMVFDLEGNYLKTLETGYSIMGYCYDKDNHRIIMTMDDEIQFAYLDLDELLD